ncbi:MAG: winged helix-turn-helix domain-containing protein, partial [Planctomycetota bacterium]
RPEDHVCTLRGVDLRRILREEFQTPYARSSVYYFLHRTLGMSYAKPRPARPRARPSAGSCPPATPSA